VKFPFIFDRPFNHKTMPRTKAQFEEIREQRVSQLLDTALELFANEGYHTTSISKIAEKAGISKGLLYNYFPGKESLVMEIINRGRAQLMDSFDPDHDGTLTPEEFEYHVNEDFRILTEHPQYWKLYFAILMQPAVYRLAYEKLSEHLPRQRSVLEQYFRAKGIADPVSEALFLDALFDGICLNFIMSPDTFPMEKMKELFINRFK
jgi:AcrR family transcriptional regulator